MVKEAAYRKGFSCPVNPTAAHKRTEKIRKSKGGILVPKDVVDDARPEDAILHPAFEWDNDAAAEMYRENQARSLLRNIVLIEKEEGADRSPEPIYINVRAVNDEPRGYRRVVDVAEDDELRQTVLQDLAVGLTAWKQRIVRFADLGAVQEKLEELAEVIEAARTAAV